MGISAFGSIVAAACGSPQAGIPAATSSAASAATAAPGAPTAASGAEAAATALPAATAVPTPAAGSVGESANVILNYWAWGGTGAVNTITRNYNVLTKVYPDLGKEIGIKALSPGQGDPDVANALRLALAAGQNIPDIVMLNRTQLPEFVDELMDLTDTFAPIKNDMYAGALEVATYNGKVMAFPMEVKSKLFFYRKDLFDQAGVKPDSIKSIDDFVNAGKALNAKFPKTYILNLGPKPAGYWLGEMLSAYPDARMADDSGAYQLTTNPAFADTFKFLKTIKDAGIAMPVDDWTTDWQPAIANEAVGGFLLANWLKFFLPTFAPKQSGQWAVTYWPALSPMQDQKFGSEAGGSVVVVPKRAPNVQAAIGYLTKTFLDKQGSVALFQNGFVTPLIKSAKGDVLDYVRNAKKPADMKDEDWAALPRNYFGPDYQQFELDSYDTVKVFNYDPAATKEFSILQQWLVKHLNGTPLDEALKGAQSDMEGQIGNPYQA